MAERRANPRIRCKIKIGVVGKDGTVSHCWSYDISRDGLQILHPERFEQGDKVDISMSLLDRVEEVFRRVAVETRVRHSVYDSGNRFFRTGLTFERYHGESQKLVEAEVDRLVENHLLTNKL